MPAPTTQPVRGLPYRAVVLRPYRELLATPGGLAFSSAGFVARMPISMIGLGIVLLVVAQGGRYGLAGTISAVFALVNALSAPAIARLVDRLGQRRVLLPTVLLHSVWLIAFIALVSGGAPTWTLFATVVVAGVFEPSVGALVRARWGYVLGSGPRLQTAYSFESVLDEVVFVLGPLLVTVLATALSEQAGLAAAIVLLLAGSFALTAQHGSEPPPSPGHEDGRGSALTAPGLWLVLALMFFLGGVFGAAEISIIGFADQAGHKALAGPLLACYAGGSMVAGILYGAVRWRSSLARRLLLGSLAMTVTVTLLPLIRSTGVLAPSLFVAGLGIAPTLITSFSLVERLVPAAQLTEGLTWATTGIVVGFACSQPITGRLVDARSAREAFTVAAASGGLAVLVCLVGYRRLHASGAQAHA
jgi:MFS family permease